MLNKPGQTCPHQWVCTAAAEAGGRTAYKEILDENRNINAICTRDHFGKLALTKDSCCASRVIVLLQYK
jgi:hypothetical protein